VRHRVDQVLVLAVAAVLAGQRTFVAIGDWIQDLRPEQRAAFGCPRWGDTYKVPSEPTVRRMLQQLDADVLDTVLTQWLTRELGQPGDGIALDGKSVRGSGHGSRELPDHVLSAVVHRTGEVMDPVDLDVKTNEIPKLTELLNPLETS
ncbi:MAG: transposase family protein, partial [Firmicutes bacterium]|nr:transposase family protein [Bacillota bacterium]